MVQSRLVLGAGDDRYEREADRVAQQVVGGAPRSAPGGERPPSLLRGPRSAQGGVVDAELQRAVEAARGGGRSLPEGVRRSMEAALGADLGGVRLHTDARADRLARALGARAFTTGRDIFFRRGECNASRSGRELLAHELTHVVQQAGGSSRGRGEGGAHRVSAAPAGNVIQRRLGFEFETTVQVRGAFYGPWAGGRGNIGVFDDEEQVYRSGSWKAVTDEGRLEFVTDPLPDRNAVRRVAGEIEAFIDGLQNVGMDTDIRQGRAGTWAPRPARPDYSVHIGQGYNFDAAAQPVDWYGQAQVSFGVATDRVERFLGRAQADQPPPPLSGLKAQLRQLAVTEHRPPMPTKGIPSGVTDMAALVDQWDAKFVASRTFRDVDPAKIPQLVAGHAANLPPAQKEKLSGIWTLMAYYWSNLSRIKQAGSYKKAQLVIMARTDFHSFYNDLDAGAKQAFRAAEADFVAGNDGAPIVGTGITLLRWYRSVSQPEAGSTYSTRPVDLLSANTSKTKGDEIATGTDKSMGQYPLEPDGAKNLAVFELRRVTPGIRVPIRLLWPHVLQPMYDFVDAVQH